MRSRTRVQRLAELHDARVRDHDRPPYITALNETELSDKIAVLARMGVSGVKCYLGFRGPDEWDDNDEQSAKQGQTAP